MTNSSAVFSCPLAVLHDWDLCEGLCVELERYLDLELVTPLHAILQPTGQTLTSDIL